MTTFNKIRKRIFEIISPSTKGDFLSIIYDVFICLLIVVSSGSVFIEIIGNVSQDVISVLSIIEYSIIGVFILDYLLHIAVADFLYPECKNYFSSLKEFLTSFDSLIDVIAILSVLLNQIPKTFALLRLLKLIKLARLLKLNDYFKNKANNRVSRFQKMEKRVHEIIAKGPKGDVVSKIYDIASLILIILSVVLFVLDTFNFSPSQEKILYILEIVIASLFALEYIVRIWTAPYEYKELKLDKARMKYIFSFMALIDLLSIFPVFVNGLESTTDIVGILKLTKILRLLKASRYLSGMAMFGEAIKKKKKAIVFSTLILLFLIILSSILVYSFEHTAQPEVFTNGFSGIYYSFSSLTGMGGTEVGPISTIGTILSSLMIILGACVFAVPTAIVSLEFSKMVLKKSRVEEKKEENKEEDKDLLESLIKNYKELSEKNKELFNENIEEQLDKNEK